MGRVSTWAAVMPVHKWRRRETTRVQFCISLCRLVDAEVPHSGSWICTCVAGTNAVRGRGSANELVSPSGCVARYLIWSLSKCNAKWCSDVCPVWCEGSRVVRGAKNRTEGIAHGGRSLGRRTTPLLRRHRVPLRTRGVRWRTRPCPARRPQRSGTLPPPPPSWPRVRRRGRSHCTRSGRPHVARRRRRHA